MRQPLLSLKNNQDFLDIIYRLTQNGFKTYVAGGAVRDAILGSPFKDIDIVTEASVQQIQNLFEKTIPVGAAFGVVQVILNETPYEVAQFRKESDYKDGRHPSLVEPGTPEEDALRRDFTMNALFYDPISETIFDYVGGFNDIKNKIIRAVGDPLTRFKEDYLRVLRGLRFVSQLNFKIEGSTKRAMFESAHLINRVSSPRKTQELKKIMEGEYFLSVFNEEEGGGILSYLEPHLKWGPLNDDISLLSWSLGRWLLYFFKAQNKKQEINNFLFSLDISRKEKNQIEKSLFWLEETSWTGELGLGFFLRNYFQDQNQESNEILCYQVKQKSPPWKDLFFNKVETYKKLLPPPILTGRDIQNDSHLCELYNGEALGKLLTQVWEWQLEGKVKSKDEVFGLIRNQK